MDKKKVCAFYVNIHKILSGHSERNNLRGKIDMNDVRRVLGSAPYRLPKNLCNIIISQMVLNDLLEFKRGKGTQYVILNAL